MDHYSILGISKIASKNEIKTAYRKKTKILHPDKGGNQDQFVELNNSYNILIDDIKRKTYDNTFFHFHHLTNQNKKPKNLLQNHIHFHSHNHSNNLSHNRNLKI